MDNIALPIFENPNETINIYKPLASSLLGREIDCAQKPANLLRKATAGIADNDPSTNTDTIRNTAENLYHNVSWKHTLLIKHIEELKRGDVNESQEVSLDVKQIGRSAKQYSSSKDRHTQHLEKLIDLETVSNAYGALSTSMRVRAVDGYLFDCVKNQKLLQDDPWLVDVWGWIAGTFKNLRILPNY